MIENIEKLFIKTFNVQPLDIKKISADGSNRQYYRIFSVKTNVIGVYNEDTKENIAFIDYARQLRRAGINVPQIYAEDIENNVYLQQDLGDTTLFSCLQSGDKNIDKWYEIVVKELPKIQLVNNFDYKNAYPRDAFDKQSIQWDLNYFKYYFLKLAGVVFNEEDLENDFARLTEYLLSCPTSYFLYRDFQSRNIMLYDDKVWFIDFQGGRKGSLQYDIASLLYDAKANIKHQRRKELLNLYLERLKQLINIDEEDFLNHYYAYVYIRIMQAMGSYGYRGYFEKKVSFLKSIPFALNNLKYLEDNIHLEVELPTLQKIFQRMLVSSKLQNLNENSNKLTITIKSFSYKKGFPQDISGNGGGFIFDCRALPNPGREERFKRMNGTDEAVRKYLESFPEVNYFLTNAMNLVNQSIENYLKRGFSNLSVYFGCTGGQHRSVYCAQKCAEILRQHPDLSIIINHIEQNI